MAKAPKNETPEARFVRMAEVRVNKALKAIALVGNLSGSRYKSTNSQIEKIQEAFADQWKNTMARLRGQAPSGGFKL